MLVRRTDAAADRVRRARLPRRARGWKDYQRDGPVCGIALPPGLRESDRLPEPIFTPATKADERPRREHQRWREAAPIVGDASWPRRCEALTLALYARGAAHAASRGIILADTKFEFGRRPRRGELLLIDEVLTPDSSRFWPADGYAPGGPQPSFDKQFVRDYLESIRWDKQPPVPSLPDEVVARTREKYLDALPPPRRVGSCRRRARSSSTASFARW